MNAISRSKRFWAFGLLATMALLLLCTLQPAQQTRSALQKRGDPYGEGMGPASFDGNDNGDEENHPWWEKQNMKHFSRVWPGPDQEPSNTRNNCDTKAWLFWLSFGAHEHDFKRHRKERDILCVPDPAWKSDACTRAPDKPFNSFQFKAACQRQDFAVLNLQQYIDRAKTLTEEQRQRERLDFNIKEQIKERFRTDLTNACYQEAGGRLLCVFMASAYRIFHH
ncbi:hypothetical protein HDK77DRAFT_98419 [Phyllosticta capitalensis]